MYSKINLNFVLDKKNSKLYCCSLASNLWYRILIHFMRGFSFQLSKKSYIEIYLQKNKTEEKVIECIKHEVLHSIITDITQDIRLTTPQQDHYIMKYLY